jgi:hypothetical protein
MERKGLTVGKEQGGRWVWRPTYLPIMMVRTRSVTKMPPLRHHHSISQLARRSRGAVWGLPNLSDSYRLRCSLSGSILMWLHGQESTFPHDGPWQRAWLGPRDGGDPWETRLVGEKPLQKSGVPWELPHSAGSKREDILVVVLIDWADKGCHEESLGTGTEVPSGGYSPGTGGAGKGWVVGQGMLVSR